MIIWNLGTHDFRYDFTFIYKFIGHEMSHMNSWSWNLTWIHDMNSDMNSWLWRISWIHMSEFICMNSPLNSCWWIHDHEIIYEFICMNSCVNSVLWIISWNHGWILGNEFTYEIMVEFIHLKLFLIQLQSSFSKGKCLLIKGNHHPSFAVSSLQAQDVEGLVSTWCT